MLWLERWSWSIKEGVVAEEVVKEYKGGVVAQEVVKEYEGGCCGSRWSRSIKDCVVA